MVNNLILSFLKQNFPDFALVTSPDFMHGDKPCKVGTYRFKSLNEVLNILNKNKGKKLFIYQDPKKNIITEGEDFYEARLAFI